MLIFDLDGARFGVDARRVCVSFWLPELTPAEEAPSWVVGLLNLRGRIVPIVDLHQRLGHPPRRCSANDQVVVLEDSDGLPAGLIVSEVIEVIDLPGDAVRPPPQFDAAGPGQVHLVVGEARVGDDLVSLLDVSGLTRFPQAPPTQPSRARGEGVPAGYFCPEATPEARALLRARAAALRDAAGDEEGERLGLAVIELGGEYFGVALAAVQEFCDIAQLSTIPCCPPHVLGAMNLRGDLLTLIDPRAALNLPAASRGGKAVVARLGEQALGIAVDAVHDVVYLRGEELQVPPAALRQRGGMEIMGTAAYAGRTLTVLDLPVLLAREEWIVNETA